MRVLGSTSDVEGQFPAEAHSSSIARVVVAAAAQQRMNKKDALVIV
jgi:hypothetical protein